MIVSLANTKEPLYVVNAFVRVPVQLVRTGRRLVFNLLSWNGWQEVFLRGVDGLRKPLRC
jgi:hypothetical protein